MSININIKQRKILKTKIDLNFLNKICHEQKLSFGIPNTAFALDSYQGDNQIENVSFIIYDPKNIGRGFCFWTIKNEINLLLNNPSTTHDIIIFYHFLETLKKKLNFPTFLQDDEIKDVYQIEAIKTQMIEWNQKVLKENVKKDLTIFGAVYPIVIEEAFASEIESCNEVFAMKLFSEYLHSKQNNDYYYAKAIIYENNQSKELLGRYALTVGATSIFPLKPYIPFNTNIDLNTKIETWEVALVDVQENDYKIAGSLTFDEFSKKIDLTKYPKFDQNHIIIELTKENINSLINKL